MDYKIFKYPEEENVLRKKSQPVKKFDEDLLDFAELLVDMMYDYDGIGLAAPQIGVHKRMFAIDIMPFLEDGDDNEWDGEFRVEIDGEECELDMPMVLVNPKIVASEGEVIFPADGCLSIPGLRGPTKRMDKITVKAKTFPECDITIEATGILSICLQHEIDHLDGILFLDRVVGEVVDITQETDDEE